MRGARMIDAGVDALVAAYMAWNELTLRRRLLGLAESPAAAQRRTLLDIIRRNADTEFGRDHGFAQMRSVEDYRARVPVRDYDALSPYIQRQAGGEARALTAQPTVYCARTSGTTGRHKDIPLTVSGLDSIKRAQKLLGVSLHREGFFKGCVLGFAGAAIEGVTESGVPYGSASGGVRRSITPIVPRKFFVPSETYSVSDYDTKYRLYALAAIAAENVTGVATANPSSILRVLDLVEQEGERLLRILEGASFPDATGETAGIVDRMRARGDPRRRAAKLRAALERDGRLTAPAIWPHLKAVATWTGGSCGVAAEQLASRLPAAVRIVDLGYSASEFMGAANIDARRNICLPLLADHFYEFIPRAARDNDEPRFLGVDELAPGEEYYVVVTTRSGLYRYDINDVVVAGPGAGKCFGIQFLQKGRGITNVTGEKLSEHQAISAVSAALKAHDVAAPVYILLADETSPHYELLLEAADNAPLDAIAATADAALQTGNAEYANKRAGKRLGPLRARRLRAGAGEAIKQAAIAGGVREAQYKPVVLDYWRNWAGGLAGLCMDET